MPEALSASRAGGSVQKLVWELAEAGDLQSPCKSASLHQGINNGETAKSLVTSAIQVAGQGCSTVAPSQYEKQVQGPDSGVGSGS